MSTKRTEIATPGKRTKARSLTLVNWRGVFFMQYALDSAVTAFEGTNGAGKTTVMIAAYVVLLPDMTRLRFTNLGETGATGGDRGIWGRLGEPGRPSFAILDLELGDGSRMLAGVELERKAEPTVEPTAFVVHGLSWETRLSDIFLDKQDNTESIPELDRIKALAQAAGGKLKSFSSAKDYFAELFDRGVLPLRMQLDEERGKLNEMLRTSMVGGISRALTGGMREFLLREETGLGEVLRRMRGNLEACRRTRREVEEAQRLESEIHGIWEAGQGMFASVVHATRAEAEEKQEAVHVARKRSEDAAAARTEIERALVHRKTRVEELQMRRVAIKAELQEAMARLERAKRAWDVARRLARQAREREALEVDRVGKEKADEEVQAQKEASRAAWDRARAALGAAGRGVADLKAGLEELERRAAEHRLALERLEQVRNALPEEDLSLESAPTILSQGQVERRVESKLAAIDDEIVKADRTIANATVLRAEYDKVHRALEKLAGLPVLSSTAHEKGREILAEFRALENDIKAHKALGKNHEEAVRLAKRQKETLEVASKFGELTSSADVQRALEEVEIAEASAEEFARKSRSHADESARRAREDEGRARELEPIMERWRAAHNKLEAVLTRHASVLKQDAKAAKAKGSAALIALRKQLDTSRSEKRTLRLSKEQELARVDARLGNMHTAAQGTDERLIAARDAVSGELLMQRFEDMKLEDAALAEAALGPLKDAISVDDPVKAAKKLGAGEDRPDEVWLVGPRAALPLDDDGTPYAERVGDSVLLEVNGVVRLTRIPSRPRLGRLAREREVTELNKLRADLGVAIDALREEERALETAISQVDELLPEAHLLDRADPSAELEQLRTQVAEAQAARTAALGEQTRATQELEAIKRRRSGLRKLLPDSHLLDMPNQAEIARDLGARLEGAKAAEARLASTANDRKILEASLDVLRNVPPAEAEVESLKTKRQTSVRIRDSLQQALGRLRWLSEHRAALGWTDAEPALAAREELRPALEHMLKKAEAEAKQAEAEVREREQKGRATAEAAARAAGLVISADQQIEAMKRELAEIGVETPGQKSVEAEELKLSGLEGQADALEQEEREARNDLVRGEERLRQASEKATEEAWRLAEEERGFVPAQQRWARLREEASGRGLLAPVFAVQMRQELDGLSSKELWPKARSKATVLAERISRAREGSELASVLRRHLDEIDSSPGSVDAWLLRWTEVRDWLKRRVPPQIAEVDDPLEALGRVRDHLTRLEERLAAQEKSLRGQSGDVARNIDAQVRRARNQVGRLNGDLDGVRFGAIEGIQIRARPAQRMEAVLRALREGAAQQLLFEPNLPIEEAMDELFKRYGGGRTGGDRLLDYREYLDLQVEVKRRGSEAWELANPTRLSTGEAIGVGAAVMMTTLKAWEHDANLLRPKQMSGTLRLLFLDEATRLSQDNLGILFELCERLELQLMIAAPEVARAEGNTTYRLIRALDARGREEVRVSGRRVLPRLPGPQA
jgi:chromosome partition protein MukB